MCDEPTHLPPLVVFVGSVVVVAPGCSFAIFLFCFLVITNKFRRDGLYRGEGGGLTSVDVHVCVSIPSGPLLDSATPDAHVPSVRRSLGAWGRRRITLKHFSPFVDPFISPPLFLFAFPPPSRERVSCVCVGGSTRLPTRQQTCSRHCSVHEPRPLCRVSSLSVCGIFFFFFFFYQCVCVFVLFFSFVIDSRGSDLLLC